MRARSAGQKASTPKPVKANVNQEAGNRGRAAGGLFLIAVAVLIAYLPSIRGGFIMDDDILLTDNKLVHASDGLYRMWFTTESLDYWPVSSTSFWLEWRLWGLSPSGYHITNLVLHILAAALIWKIFAKLGFGGGFLAAILFAVHPVNVESVAWIAQRKNTLSIVFFLLSILTFIRADEQHRRFSGWYAWSIVCFVLAMLSKGSVAFLPLILVGLLAWRRRKMLRVWEFGWLAPYFIVAIALTLVNVWFQTHGADKVIRDVTPLGRLLGAPAVVFFYLYKALVPLNLVFVYPNWHVQANDWRWWLPLAAGIVVSIVLVILYRTRRSRWAGWLLPAWGFFIIALIPVMGFTDVGFMKYSLVADHYQYIALIAVCAIVAAGWSRWQQSFTAAARWIPLSAAVALVAVLTLLSWNQSSLYRDPVTLYEATLEKNPECWIAHNNLGAKLFDAADYKDARAHFEQALKFNPACGDAECNLGNTLIQLGSPEEAKIHIAAGLKLSPERLDSRNNLGHLLLDENKVEQAIQCFTEILQYDPQNVPANFNLGNALIKAGNPLGAVDCYKKVLHENPDHAEARCNLGIALATLGQRQEAIDQFEQAVKYKPDYAQAYYRLANTLLELNRFQEAIPNYERAIRLKPDYTQAYANVAQAYAITGRRADAAAAARRAIELARASGQTSLVPKLQQFIDGSSAPGPGGNGQNSLSPLGQ